MADIVHNAIRASYPIWIWCDKCNERVELVGVRSCIENGEYITVIDINHKCKEKEDPLPMSDAMRKKILAKGLLKSKELEKLFEEKEKASITKKKVK